MTKKHSFLYIFLIFTYLLCFSFTSIAAEEQMLQYSLYAMPTDTNSAKQSTVPFKDAESFLLALTLTPESGTYFYGAKTDMGLPTKVSVTLISPEGDVTPKEFAVRFPPAQLKKNTIFKGSGALGTGDDNTPIYTASTSFIVLVKGYDPRQLLNAQVSGLFCSETNCTPFTETITLPFIQNINQLPSAKKAPWWSEYYTGTDLRTSLIPAVIAPKTVGNDTEVFFGAPSKENGLLLATANGSSNVQDEAVLISASVASLGITPQYFSSSMEVEGVGEALVFGLLAGVILNLMPCVLPVLSLKFSALLAVSAMTDKRKQARAFRLHCFIFALGILTWFFVLAVLLGVAGWAWGELFQNPIAIAILGLILFLLALSLFGVFSLPIFDLKVATKSNPHWQAFASGLLATLLATPCSGPLLGGVIGWAIRQPLPLLMTSVMCVGVGMALPYCILAFKPALINLLPRPGSWTLRLEQLLGFFLMASVAYLLLLLPSDWFSGYLAVLVAVAFAAWLWGQIGHLGASTRRRIIARLLACAVLGCALLWANSTIHKDFSWQPFSFESFRASFGNEPVLLEFTADWCPSCKVLEKTTLRQERMAAWRDKFQLKTYRVDLTKPDQAASDLLETLGSKSIPLIAIFPMGEKARKPVVLRDLVTSDTLEEALEEALEE